MSRASSTSTSDVLKAAQQTLDPEQTD
jgi:hypothetical protein